MATDRETYAPLVLMEYDHKPGHFGLMLTDSAMVKVDGPFQAVGHEGGGYDWTAVAAGLVAHHRPELEGRFGFDPEAGMFVAYGSDRPALEALAAELARAFAEPARLSELIKTADFESWD